MTVAVKGYLNAAVSQSLLDHLGVNPLLEHKGGMGVPGIMEAYHLKASLASQGLPGACDTVGTQGLTVKMTEYQIIIGKLFSQHGALLLLLFPILPEYGGIRGCQGYGAPALG
jgi:hypothetical protein